MVETFKNIVSKQELTTLREWWLKNDHYVEDRIDVRSKIPNVDKSDWPKEVLVSILEKANVNKTITEVLVFGSKISFKLHVDTGQGINAEPLYKNVLIPLEIQGQASTVVFDNHWYDASTRFGREDLSPYRYQLPNRWGKFVDVGDVRLFLEKIKQGPIEDFNVSEDFIKSVEHIVHARTVSKTVDSRVSDYSRLTNYNPDILFDSNIHKQYLSHIPIESLHGLTVHTILEWQVGDVYTFDRSHLHCAGSGHDYKVGITVFTNMP